MGGNQRVEYKIKEDKEGIMEKTKTINPCRECIVKSMCDNACDTFIEYIKYNLPLKLKESSWSTLAHDVKKDNMVMWIGETNVKFLGDTRTLSLPITEKETQHWFRIFND